MTTIDKDQTIARWEHILEHGKDTLSPGMLDLIQATLSSLREKDDPQKQKALNTWVDMLVRNNVPTALRKQVEDTVLLLKRSEQRRE